MTQNRRQTETPQDFRGGGEEHFRAAFEQSPISTQIFAPDGRTVWVNHAWEKLWGVTLAQVSDYNILNDRQLVERGVMPFIKSAFAGEPSEIPPVFYDPDETIPQQSVNPEPRRWVSAYAFPVRDETGAIREIVLMHEDITARVRAEEAERRWTDIFEHVEWGVVVGSSNGERLLVMNPAYARLHGYTVAELTGHPMVDVFAPAERAGLAEHLRITRERSHHTFESIHLRKDGTQFPVVVESAAIKDADGEVRYFAAHVRDVTEQRQIETELKRSEEKYRNLLENANDIIYAHDLEGNYLTINRAGENATGYTREQILGGLNIAQVVAPEQLELAREMTRRKFTDPSPTVYEVDMIAKDGRRLTLEVSTRISYRDGQPVAVEGIARDVTERKQAAAEIERSRKQIEIILQGVAESITAQDTTGRLIYANDAAARTLGFPSSQALLETPMQELVRLVELFDETGQPFARERLPGQIAFKEGRSAEATMRYRFTSNGEERWLIVKATPVFDEAGQVQFAINIFQDITERRRDEQAQQFLAEASGVIASSLDYETTLASVARMAVPTLADWCTVDVLEEDHTVKRLAVAHIDPAKVAWAHELQRRFPPDMNAPQGVPKVLRNGQSELYTEITDEMLVAAAHDAEHLQIMREIGFTSAMIVPLVAHGRTLGALTFISTESRLKYRPEDLSLAENVAQRAAIAIDNARLYRSAQEANRLKDEFLATVSHELRTPLTAILGWASMLRTERFDEAAVKRALETIERNARTQSQLIDDLLDMSRIITGKLRLEVRTIEPNPFIEAAIEGVKPAAEAKGLQVQKFIDTTVVSFSGDPIRLQQVVWNLLSNAIKFTPQGGLVQISLKRVNAQIEIAISDSGAGIAPEFLPYVFDRFRQADSSITRTHGGLGLGLAIVRHLTELHGGTVRAESAGVGRGAIFTVLLPLLPASQHTPVEERVRPTAHAQALPPSSSEKLGGLKILVVDDEADTREMLRVALTQCGAEVSVAGSSRAALAQIERFKPDLLISDIEMPEEDGYELIRQVRSLPAERGGDVPAVALTAYAGAEDRLRVLQAGYQMHVPKPVESAELVAVVLTLIHRP